MRVLVLRGQLVQVQQSLVDVLLQLQSALHGLQAAAPLVTVRLLHRKETHQHAVCTAYIQQRAPVRTQPCTNLDVLEEDASSSLVLEGQQLLCVLPFLVAVLLEEMAEAWKGHIIPGEVESLKETRGG